MQDVLRGSGRDWGSGSEYRIHHRQLPGVCGTADRVDRTQGTQEGCVGLEKEDSYESSFSGRSRRAVATQETIKKRKRKKEET